MWLKWHVKWDPLIIKVSFKCKFRCAGACSVGLISEVWIARADNKSFFFPHFAPDSAAFSSHHSTLYMLWFSMQREVPTVTSPAVGVHLWIHIRSHVIPLTPLSPLGALRSSTICSSFLPRPAPSLRCLEFGRRKTSAPLRWEDRPARPPGGSSRC